MDAVVIIGGSIFSAHRILDSAVLSQCDAAGAAAQFQARICWRGECLIHPVSSSPYVRTNDPEKAIR